MTLYKMHCDYCPGYEYTTPATDFETADAYGVRIDWECIGGSKFTVCPRCLKKVFDSVLTKPEPGEKLKGVRDL